MVLQRRVVHLITEYLQPKEIFKLITQKTWDYSVLNIEEYGCRDRAMMAIGFASAGRITEICGGHRFKWNKEKKKGEKTGLKHDGIQVENLKVSENHILISNMRVVKRSQKLLLKYGEQITHRDDFVIPLKCGLFTNSFWDQLVPFGWLIKEYLGKYAPKEGKLFRYEDTRAWQIINKVTGKFPNWFRAQAEHFYGHFLLTDTIKLAKFVNIQDPKHVKHYIGYSWTEQLKDTTVSMDFDWVAEAVMKIENRLGYRK